MQSSRRWSKRCGRRYGPRCLRSYGTNGWRITLSNRMAPMRPLFYDKDGKPVSLKQWAKLIEDRTYRRVAETILPDGTWISTVLLGLDHRFTMEGPPVIFETMVFPDAENLRERDCERYATQEEAIAGHATMVQKWSPGEKVRGPMRITKIGAQAYEVTGHNPRNLTEKVVVTVWGEIGRASCRER